MDANFPQQESPLVGTSCDIIYQDKIEANINMANGSSTVSCSPFFLAFFVIIIVNIIIVIIIIIIIVITIITITIIIIIIIIVIIVIFTFILSSSYTHIRAIRAKICGWSLRPSKAVKYITCTFTDTNIHEIRTIPCTKQYCTEIQEK